MTKRERYEAKVTVCVCVSHLPVRTAAVPLAALVATLHPLNQTRLMLHPSQRWRGRGTHCPTTAQTPGLPDQPEAHPQFSSLPPWCLLQPGLCGGSRCRRREGTRGLQGLRGTRQSAIAQRRASVAGEDAVNIQSLSPGPPGWPVVPSWRTREMDGMYECNVCR